MARKLKGWSLKILVSVADHWVIWPLGVWGIQFKFSVNEVTSRYRDLQLQVTEITWICKIKVATDINVIDF